MKELSLVSESPESTICCTPCYTFITWARATCRHSSQLAKAIPVCPRSTPVLQLDPQTSHSPNPHQQQHQPACQSGPGEPCPRDSVQPTLAPAPTSMPKQPLCSLPMDLPEAQAHSSSSLPAKDTWYAQSTKQKLLHKPTPSSTERLLFHLTHRNKHGETVKMRRQKTMYQMKKLGQNPSKRTNKMETRNLPDIVQNIGY